MPSLADDFYSGSLFGEPTRRKVWGVYDQPRIFDQEAYGRAMHAGYSQADINGFLKESGVRASGPMFQVGGMREVNPLVSNSRNDPVTRRSDLYWQVTPGAEPWTPPAPVAPDYGNTVNKTIALPNGTGTIETINSLPSAASASAPILGDPLGEQSQRISRQKVRLSIAK